jgi:hypothetical protein
MNKKIIFTVGGILIVIFLILAFLKISNIPGGHGDGGCRFEAFDSTNTKIMNTEDVFSVLTNNNWKLTEGFEESQIKEVNMTNDQGISVFIKDKSIRYWEISVYKKYSENNTRRADLIDENGRLYKFYNCV